MLSLKLRDNKRFHNFATSEQTCQTLTELITRPTRHNKGYPLVREASGSGACEKFWQSRDDTSVHVNPSVRTTGKPM